MSEGLALRDDAGSLVELLPARGALVARFQAAGEEVLFVDAPALATPGANVHGGIPVLFPMAGKLPEGTYEHAGKTWSMPQHGFGRTRAWRLVEATNDAARSSLASDAASLAVFPWRFEAELRVRLRGGALALELSATNHDATPMPFHAGFHPYFTLPRANKSAARVETDARHAFDNVTGKRGPVGAIDLNELDLHLEDHGRDGTVLHRGPGLRKILLEWSGAKRVVLWSRRDADFVCVEPWTASGGALATRDPDLPWIEPRGRATLALTIRLA